MHSCARTTSVKQTLANVFHDLAGGHKEIRVAREDLPCAGPRRAVEGHDRSHKMSQPRQGHGEARSRDWCVMANGATTRTHGHNGARMPLSFEIWCHIACFCRVRSLILELAHRDCVRKGKTMFLRFLQEVQDSANAAHVQVAMASQEVCHHRKSSDIFIACSSCFQIRPQACVHAMRAIRAQEPKALPIS